MTGPPTTLELGPPRRSHVSCTLGAHQTPTSSIDYFLPPNDRYFALLDPAACTGCGGNLINLIKAHISLDFRTRCRQPVTIQIVGAKGTPECPVPDPDHVVCPSQVFELEPTATGVFEFALSLPTDCCITERAFLCMTIDGFGADCNDASTRPMLPYAGAGPCAPCRVYNFYDDPNGHHEDDMCLLFPHGSAFPGPPVLYTEADCCTLVPVLPSTWGSLKIRYRSP